MLSLAGYAERLSVRPGETIRFHVASDGAAPVSASVVRVICADPNPAGPGIRKQAVAASVREVAKPQRQAAPLGSYAVIPGSAVVAGLGSFTAVVNVWIGGSAGTPGCIWAFGDLASASHRVLISAARSANGIGFAASVGLGSAMPVEIATADMQPECWYTLVLTHDAEERALRLSCVPLDGTSSSSRSEARLDREVALGGVGEMRFAGGLPGGTPGTPTGCFSGRIERPILFAAALKPQDFDPQGKSDVSALVAAWDFSREIGSSRIVDIGPHGLHGRLVNLPTRAVTGSRWDGTEMSWRHAPQQYGAIHFHADDIDDCGWPVTHEWTVPAETRSGVYALELAAGDEHENIPFFVVPPKGTRTARIALLVSTFTYTIYGNHARPEWLTDPAWQQAWRTQTKEWGGYPHNPGDHRDLGLSTYNFHTDGSGIAYASWHRPMLNVRIGYITYPDPAVRGSGLRHFPADSHLTAWLETKGYDFDVITDWELHHEGYDAAEAVPSGDDRLASRVPHPRDAGCADAVSRSRWPLHVPRRQRLLLEDRAVAGEGRRDRDPPCRGRHSRLGGGGRRVLQRLRRRVRRHVAPQRPAAAEARRRRVHGAGQFQRLVLSRAAGGAATHASPGCWTASATN